MQCNPIDSDNPEARVVAILEKLETLSVEDRAELVAKLLTHNPTIAVVHGSVSPEQLEVKIDVSTPKGGADFLRLLASMIDVEKSG